MMDWANESHRARGFRARRAMGLIQVREGPAGVLGPDRIGGELVARWAVRAPASQLQQNLPFKLFLKGARTSKFVLALAKYEFVRSRITSTAGGDYTINYYPGTVHVA